jgi:hypothetical protein
MLMIGPAAAGGLVDCRKRVDERWRTEAGVTIKLRCALAFAGI